VRGWHQAELAEGFVGVEPDLFHDVADAQAVDPRLVELRAVFCALVAAGLPGQAASQHLWRQGDGDLAYDMGSGGHIPFSRLESRLSRYSASRHSFFRNEFCASIVHNRQTVDWGLGVGSRV
jgi:hypothetical protein